MAQSGRASALGAEGRRFESYYSDHFNDIMNKNTQKIYIEAKEYLTNYLNEKKQEKFKPKNYSLIALDSQERDFRNQTLRAMQQQLHTFFQNKIKDIGKNVVENLDDRDFNVEGTDLVVKYNNVKYACQLKASHNTDNASSKRANKKGLIEFCGKEYIPVYATIGTTGSGKDLSLQDKKNKNKEIKSVYGKGCAEFLGYGSDEIEALQKAYKEVYEENRNWFIELM